MKKLLSIILAVFILASLFTFCVSADKTDGNLLRNGSFDSPDLTHWWQRGDWSGGLINYVQDAGIDGSGCMVAVGNGYGTARDVAGTYYTEPTVQEGAAPISLIAGEEYTLTGYVLRPEGVYGYGTIDVAENPTDRVLFTTPDTEKNGEWEKLSVTFIAPEQPVWIRMTATGLVSGQRMYFDEITLVCNSGNHYPDFEDVKLNTSDIMGNNFFENGSFESLDIRKWWSREDWNGGLFTYDRGNGVDGGSCLMATGEGAGTADQNAGVYYTGEKYNLNALKTYYMACDVYREDGVDAPVTLVVRNADDSVFMESESATANGVWEHISMRFIAPDAPVMLTIRANALAEGEHVYIDNVELREVGVEPTEEEDVETEQQTGSSMGIGDEQEEPEGNENPAVEEEIVEEDGGKYTVAIIIGVIVLLIVVAILILAKKNKKGK